MTSWLRHATPVDIVMGPFRDAADGFTAETGLTINQADVRLNKNGGTTWAQKSQTSVSPHQENGWYRVPFNVTDTGTLGLLTVAIDKVAARPVSREFMVVPADIYDAYILATLGLPGQGDPPAIGSAATFQAYTYKGWRNKKTQSPTQFNLFADDGTTVDQKSTVSGGDPTTFGEMVSGP